MGVDIKDIGAPCRTSFMGVSGKIRAVVKTPAASAKEEYGNAGFVGLLRPDLYTRMLDESQKAPSSDLVTIYFDDGEVVHTPLLIGADGIDAIVRTHLWGSGHKRPHDLHVIGGFTFDTSTVAPRNEVAICHSSFVQGTYTSILSKARKGHQWWVLEAWPDDRPGPDDLRRHAQQLVSDFPSPLPELIDQTLPENVQRWPIRDIKPLAQWSKGRITLAGDAAHATSPYAAYGAGMSICDGYWLAQVLAGVELKDTSAVRSALLKYEQQRIPHTTEQVQTARFLGILFHHIPYYLTFLRDLVLDYTPLLQWQLGDHNPKEISKELYEMGNGILQPRAA